MTRRYESALDLVIAAFAVWTLCCHGTVLLRGTGYHLMVVAAVALLIALAVYVVRWRRASPRAAAGELERVEGIDDAPEDGRVRAAGAGLVVLLAATTAGAVADYVSPLALYCACAGYLLLASVYVLRRPAARLSGSPPEIAGHDVLLGVTCVLSACLALFMHRDNTDDSFYVNVAVALADHPDWGLFDRNTLHGLKGPPPAMYHITSFELLGGVISWLSGKPALLVIHWVFGSLAGFAIPIALARLFRFLDPKRWELLMLAALTLYIFDGTTQFGFSMHGFARIYQGKAIMWTVLVPVTAVYGMELGAAPSLPRALRLMAAQVAGIGLSSTGLWMMPAVACISVLVPIAWDRRTVRGALYGLASTLYPVAVALWVRHKLIGHREVASIVESATGVAARGLDFVTIGHAADRTLGSQPMSIVYGLMLAAAPVVVRNRLARRYLIAFTFVTVVVLTNPYLFKFVRKNLIGESTYERGLWLLPLPAALAFCAVALVPTAEVAARIRYGRALIGAALLALFYATLPPRIATPSGQLRFPPGPKVQLEPFATAQLVTSALPEGAFVVADRKVSVHLPLLHHPTMPVMAKESYFRGPELDRRTRLRDFVMRRRGPITPGLARWLWQELDHYKVSGLVPTSGSEKTRGMRKLLTSLGFERAGAVGKYRVWVRDYEQTRHLVPTTLATPPKP